MKILNDKQIHIELTKLLNSSQKIYISTAWATTGFDAYNALKANKDRICQMVVGLHFFQTSPDFIREFINNENVRFVTNSDGVFHPKMFLFEDEDGDWKCIIGSANFTRGASQNNTETALLINSKDNVDQTILEDIKNSIEHHWNTGCRFTDNQFETYQKAYNRKQKYVERLSGNYGKSQPQKSTSPLSSYLFTMSWQAYLNKIREENTIKHSERIHVIGHSRLLFEKFQCLFKMNYEDRKIIAGFATEPETPTESEHWWNLFGSTIAVGYFKQAIRKNNQEISDALDIIPLTGKVTQSDYNEYIKLFKNSFQGSGLPTATRLLTMKRPDYFFCLNSKNKKAFSKEFGIPASRIDMENYWEEAIERIIDSNWWNSNVPTNSNDKVVWSARVAFLDALFYEE